MSSFDDETLGKPTKEQFPGEQMFRNKPEFLALIDIWADFMEKGTLDEELARQALDSRRPEPPPSDYYVRTFNEVFDRAREICERDYPMENPGIWTHLACSAAAGIKMQTGMSRPDQAERGLDIGGLESDDE